MMLFDEYPLLLDKRLAVAIGLNEALILQQVHYWIELNKKNGRNHHKGRYWTYNTIEKWQEEFPFWSKETVKRTLKKLRDMELIIVGNFNTYQMDRTLWYTIDYEKLNESIESNSSFHEVQNDLMEDIILTSPIPEITTENTADISNQSISQFSQCTMHDSQCTIEKTKKILHCVQDDRQKDYQDNFNINYEKIIHNCELYAIDESYRDSVGHAIRLLLLDAKNHKRIKIGDNLIPSHMILRDMAKMNFFTIEHAVNKFKEASERVEIRNSIAYLKSCIYNAIYEVRVDLDVQLRYIG